MYHTNSPQLLGEIIKWRSTILMICITIETVINIQVIQPAATLHAYWKSPTQHFENQCGYKSMIMRIRNWWGGGGEKIHLGSAFPCFYFLLGYLQISGQLYESFGFQDEGLQNADSHEPRRRCRRLRPPRTSSWASWGCSWRTSCKPDASSSWGVRTQTLYICIIYLSIDCGLTV